MLRWTTLRTIFVALFVVTSACQSCTDGTVANNGTNNRQEPETEVPAGSRLEHVAEGMEPCSTVEPICSKNVTFSAATALKVRLVNGEGQPIDNTNINFQLNVGNATGTTLESAGAVSDAAGLAETAIRGGTTSGIAEVVVTAGGEQSSVSPIKFIIAVNPKGASSYNITFNHKGSAQLGDVKVRAFASNVTCAQVQADRENPVLTSQTSGQTTAGADGTIPPVLIPNVPNGTAYTIEAKAMSRTNPEVEAAFGCKDGNPAVENGAIVDVEVDIFDNLPRLAGTYDANHTFSILGAVCQPDGNGGFSGVIPSGVCTAIDLIGRLATDPGSFLVGDGMGGDGILQLIVDFLPDGGLKDSINAFLNNSFIQDVAGNVLNDFFLEWIENEAPDWVKNTVNITGDIYESLKDFRVNGVIRIRWEPTASYDEASQSVIGVLEIGGQDNMTMPGEQVWNEVVVYWTGDCAAGNEACRERAFSANDVGTDGVVTGEFTGSVVPLTGEGQSGYGLIIDQHSLTLNYGAFILGVLEKIVLPSVFGDQTVNSVEAAIEKMLGAVVGGEGCVGFGDWVDDNIGGGGNVATSLCNNLLQRAGEGIRTYLTENLTLSGEDNFVIGTPDGVPCKLYEPAMYGGTWESKPLPYVEAMGKNQPMLECEWQVGIKYGDGADQQIQTAGTFHATRSGF